MTAADALVAEPAHALAHPRSTMRRSLGDIRTRIGVVLVTIVVLAAILGPAFAPHDPTETLAAPFQGGSSESPLGTDFLGRDVLSRVLHGGVTLLWMSLASALLGVVIGVVIGMTAGYSRSSLDGVLMRPLELVQSLPPSILILLFVSMLGADLWLIVLLVALAWVAPAARLARGVTLDVTTTDYIEAAEVLGIAKRRILWREVLPNMMTPLTIELGIRITYSITLIAAVSFLGFGVQPPNTDWGLMINENRTGMTIQPLATVVPIACIVLFTVGTNLLTEGIARTTAGIDRGASE
jgi:peptide/nickel transport system permease protein